jgi:hypothetical protein
VLNCFDPRRVALQAIGHGFGIGFAPFFMANMPHVGSIRPVPQSAALGVRRSGGSPAILPHGLARRGG